MISTEIKNKPLRLEDPIKLIDIDFTNFLKNSRPILSQFADKVKSMAHLFLAINENGKIQIVNDDYYSFKNFIKTNKIYGISNNRYLIYKSEKYDIDNQITNILTSYQFFLQTNIQEEQKMNFFELSTLDNISALFTEEAYISYAIPRIMTGDLGILDVASKNIIINNFDLFAKMLLSQPNFITSLSNIELRNYCNVLCVEYSQAHNATTAAISVLTEKVTTFE